MIIGINALQIIPGKSGGDGTYVKNLVHFLPIVDKENEYVLFLTEENKEMFPEKTTQMRRVICPITNRSKILRAVWEQTVFLKWIEREKIDVFHSTVNVSPLMIRCASVLTIHDVEPYAFPELISKGHLLYWRLTRGRSARMAKKIIAVSNSLKEGISKHMNVPPSKIAAIHHGIDHSIFNTNQHTGDLMELPERFILWAGVFYPRKNLLRLLDAFKGLLDRGCKEVVLVLLRTPGSFDEPGICGKIAELSDNIRVIDRVPLDKLPGFYQRALFFVFPSLDESFGLPVVESMACGTPVIASNKSALPEIVGDAGILIDPYNVEELSLSMERMLVDSHLRESLREKGLKRAEKFSWERTAKETVEVYREAAGMGNSGCITRKN